MKRLISLLVGMCVLTGMLAQTQTGYVKTKGRIGSNGKVVPGSRLPGTTVQIKGRNAVVTQAGGTFSFPVPGNRFFIQNVKKQGYILTDPEMTIRQYVYSANPIILVLETPEQQTADKLDNERKIRRTLQRQLQAREDEIESLKEKNQITTAQYQEALQQLYAEQQSNERLISDMAERYCAIDFDQEDEFNRRIGECIINGRLTEADSLLRSKGDINTRIAALNQHHQANVQTRSDLEKSEAMEQRNRNDIARDCHHFYEKFFMEHRNDSAAHYIELRAALDESNPQWQFDAGCFFQKRGLQQQAQRYYRRALEAARQLAQTDDNQLLLAQTINNVALLQAELGHNDQAITLFHEALAIYSRLAEETPDYRTFVASVQNNLGTVLTGNNAAAEQIESLFNQALDTYLNLAREDARAHMPQVAAVMNNLGLLYNKNNAYTQSEKMHRDALEIYRRLAVSEPQAYQPDVAATLNNLATLYHRNDIDGQACESMLEEAANIFRGLASEDMTRYGPQLAATLSNLAIQYHNHHRDAEAYRAIEEELETYNTLSDWAPATWLARLAQKAYDQGIACYQADAMEQSKRFFQSAIDAYRKLEHHEPGTWKPDLARALRNQATVLDRLQLTQQSGELYLEELAINQQLAKEAPGQYESDIARSYGNLANHALINRDFKQAVDYAHEGLAHDDSKLFIHANLAMAYLCLGDIARARDIYSQYSDVLKETFLDDLHQFSALGVIPAQRQSDAQSIIDMLSQ